MSDDLPTFERPTTAISGKEAVGNCSGPAQLLINSAFRIFTRLVIRVPHAEVNHATSQRFYARAAGLPRHSACGVGAALADHAVRCLGSPHEQSDEDGTDGSPP